MAGVRQGEGFPYVERAMPAGLETQTPVGRRES